MSRNNAFGAAVVACALFVLFAVIAGRQGSYVVAPTAAVAATDTRASSFRDERNSRLVGGYNGALTGIVSSGLLSNPLINPLAAPREKLRALSSMTDPFEAQLLAVRSGDPLLVVAAVHLTMHCMESVVTLSGRNVREMMAENSRDPKTGAKVPPNEMIIALTEAQLTGPRRVYPPADIRPEISALIRDSLPAQEATYRRQRELMGKLAAPLAPLEKAAYDRQIQQSSDECRGRTYSTAFGAEYRAALDRLVANGVVSAMLFNRNAGWQSDSITSLNDRDHALVERAMNEFQPDGVAQLLSARGNALGQLDYTRIPDDATEGAFMLEFHRGALAACDLGVGDCGPSNWRFRVACMNYGGCDQPDLAALLRSLFARDGLDPNLIDREVGRVVAAYRARDLDALGIRRKPPTN